jgi:hypothetical protein
MYIYKTMGSMTVPVEKYIITIEGLYSKVRIPCLDALVGTMLELKSDAAIVEPPVELPVESPVEPPVMEAPEMA